MWQKDSKDTSWQKVGRWYSKQVGDSGHYYHEHVIIPGIKRLLDLEGEKSLLDLACGQGILGREFLGDEYLGIDIAKGLIDEAKQRDRNKNHQYWIGDVTKEMKLKEKFDQATIILALQNLSKPKVAIENAKENLKDGGKLLLVINHPAFRIPKHSDWGFDEQRRVQYRRMDGYLTPIEIPIESSPFDKEENETTFSYHYPLSAYSEMIFDNGLVIENIEEWISDKKSEGGRAVIENKARREFPLFMAIVARKI